MPATYMYAPAPLAGPSSSATRTTRANASTAAPKPQTTAESAPKLESSDAYEPSTDDDDYASLPEEICNGFC